MQRYEQYCSECKMWYPADQWKTKEIKHHVGAGCGELCEYDKCPKCGSLYFSAKERPIRQGKTA